MRYIITDIHKDAPSYNKRDRIIGKEATQVSSNGSFEGYNSCYYLSDEDRVNFLSNAKLEEVKK